MNLVAPSRAAAIFLPLILSACADHHTAPPPFIVRVGGPAESCSIEVEGRRLSSDAFLATARRAAKSGRRAHIDADKADVPYRCVGGVIFALQMAGFKDLGLEDLGIVAEPTSPRR